MPINTVISYPIPLYSNPPIEPQFYQPKVFFISSVTLGITTLVTTTIDHDYVIGQLVRLIIPAKFGCRALNEREGYVTSIPNPNQVLIDIDSNDSDPFIPSPTFLPFQNQTLPQILAVGEINSGAINSHGRIQNITYISGSFINISPL